MIAQVKWKGMAFFDH